MSNEANSNQPNNQNIREWYQSRQFILLLLIFVGIVVIYGLLWHRMNALSIQMNDVLEVLAAVEFDTIEAQEFSRLLNIEQAEERALGYLGIFEAIGTAITFGGVLVAVFGAVLGISLNNARNDLVDNKTEYQKMTSTLKESLDSVKELQTKLAEQEAQLNKAESAYTDLNVLAQQSNLAQFYMNVAETQHKLGELSGAYNTYDDAYKLTPLNPVPLYHMGYILTQQEKLEEARDILNKALKMRPDFPQAMAALGYTYRRMGDKSEGKTLKEFYAKAEKLLTDALHASPRLVDDEGESWHGALGGMFKRLKNWESAIYHYRKASKVTPLSSYPINNIALIYLQQGNKLALDEYRTVERLTQKRVSKELDRYWDYSDLLSAQLVLGKNTEAEETLGKFFDILSPEVVDVLPRVIDSMIVIRDAPPFDGDLRNKDFIDHIIKQLEEEQQKRKEAKENGDIGVDMPDTNNSDEE